MSIRIKTLTDQELEAAYLARYDLGPGYPQLEVSDYVKRLYLDDTIEEISLRFPPHWSPEKQRLVDDDLSNSLRLFLGIDPNRSQSTFATFSGSIALDRALASVQIISRSRKKERIRVITTTPCIDIMKLFLSERTEIVPSFIESNVDDKFGRIDVTGICNELENLAAQYPNDQLCVLISSPENPTGEVWTAHQFKRIGASCLKTEAVLIVDHCFAVAGVHAQEAVARIWDTQLSELDWIAVWDTGKTFGLNEDKLGFLIANSARTKEAITQALAVLQFGVARRAKLFYAELFRKAAYYHHIEQLREHCRANLKTLVNRGSDRFRVRPMKAGSLALVDISGTGATDETIRERLIGKGVGVVSGNVFFHSDWTNTSFIRIALARRPDYFDEAVSALLENLE